LGWKKIKNLSLDTGLTFYDSAYVVVTQKAGLVLVTDDSFFSRIATKYLYSNEF
jgi:predicted nucleic acid-binding protein